MFTGSITALVTPMRDGAVDEDGFRAHVEWQIAEGTHGLVPVGTTGESPTLSHDEHKRVVEICIETAKGRVPVIAGAGSNNTREAIDLARFAEKAGADAVLVVTPYYNKPNRLGIRAHFEAVAGSTDRPIVVYNIPSRAVIDIPNDLLAELGEIDNVVAVKQARYDDMQPIDGLDLLAGNDEVLAKVMDMGGSGGILVASHLVGREMRRIIDEPDSRHEIEDGLRDLYGALSVTTNPIPLKAALNMIGHDVGGLRLPLVEATEDEKTVIRAALERHELLAAV
jgi:4-hydroxy-tetrahydrodipicolinate synthase